MLKIIITLSDFVFELTKIKKESYYYYILNKTEINSLLVSVHDTEIRRHVYSNNMLSENEWNNQYGFHSVMR